jgi:peptide/nickel transport system ATP-binding protein
VLEATGLWCRYGSEEAVRGIDIALAEGEALGVIGESGSGKSTLLRALVGLHAPAAGVVRYRGAELDARVARRSRETRRAIQLVFQNPESSLNPRHTVGEIVGRPVSLFRNDVPRDARRGVVDDLLETMKLPRSVYSRYPRELSGGQKQRVALARAFAAAPSVLLCDEVTSALDVSVQAAILELISELASTSGTAIVFVSHDLGVVRAVTSRAVVIRRGEICEQGMTGHLLSAPSHTYTQELIAAIPELAPEGAAASGNSA